MYRYMFAMEESRRMFNISNEQMFLQIYLSFQSHCCILTILEPNQTVPSLNSTMALRALESARAITQKSLVRPQPSCRSTLMASSSSLNTYSQQM